MTIWPFRSHNIIPLFRVETSKRCNNDKFCSLFQNRPIYLRHSWLLERPTFIDNLYVWSSVLSPFAWSRRYGFLRRCSRSRLKNSHSFCLQTLPTLFFSLIVSKIIISACITRKATDILTSHCWNFLITINHVDENESTTTKLPNFMQSFWSYARTYSFLFIWITFHTWCCKANYVNFKYLMVFDIVSSFLSLFQNSHRLYVALLGKFHHRAIYLHTQKTVYY